MEAVLEFVKQVNSRMIWGLPMVALMLGTGICLTVVTRGAVFTDFRVVLRDTVGTLLRPAGGAEGKDGVITPFQAVCTALAATVGTGNIVGVALAIATGGPGAVFWLWVSALVGMVIKYGEVTLAVASRRVSRSGQTVGGPMYYIPQAMGSRIPAVLFAVFGSLAAMGIGAAVQANALSGSADAAFGIPSAVTGAIASALSGLIFLGGLRRIARVTELLVPLMTGGYILGAVAVLWVNAARIPEALGLILRSAFTGTAATGGFVGAGAWYACRIGMARGVFTHEAGMGSAPIAHAAADNDHPARQGLWGAFEVFFDSIVMCTVTALVILTTGVWKDPALTADPRRMSAEAFESAFSGGRFVVAAGMCLFAFATVVAWYHYGERCVDYLSGESRRLRLCYRIAYTTTVYLGCVAPMEAVWEFADLFNGLMALPNLLALWMLSSVIRKLSGDFFRDPDVIWPRSADFGWPGKQEQRQ